MGLRQYFCFLVTYYLVADVTIVIFYRTFADNSDSDISTIGLKFQT